MSEVHLSLLSSRFKKEFPTRKKEQSGQRSGAAQEVEHRGTRPNPSPYLHRGDPLPQRPQGETPPGRSGWYV